MRICKKYKYVKNANTNIQKRQKECFLLNMFNLRDSFIRISKMHNSS